MNDKTNGAPRPAPDQDPAAKRSAVGGSRAQERIAALDTSGAATAAQLEELQAQLAAALARAEEAEAGWQRSRADFSNLKRRGEEERAGLAAAAADRLLLRVVELADDFDLSVEHVPEELRGNAWLEGINAIDRKLRGLLDAEGITPMGEPGQPFDPYRQQAISYEDDPGLPDGTVTRVLQRGYLIGDRVLRPALVAVARNDGDIEPD